MSEAGPFRRIDLLDGRRSTPALEPVRDDAGEHCKIVDSTTDRDTFSSRSGDVQAGSGGLKLRKVSEDLSSIFTEESMRPHGGYGVFVDLIHDLGHVVGGVPGEMFRGNVKELLILASFFLAAGKVLLANLVLGVLEHPIRDLEVTQLVFEVLVEGDLQFVVQELSFGGSREDLVVGLLVGLPCDL